MIYELMQTRIGVSWLAFGLLAFLAIWFAVSIVRHAWRGWRSKEVPPEAGALAPLPTATTMPRSRFPAIRRQALPAIERHNDFGAVSHVDAPRDRRASVLVAHVDGDAAKGVVMARRAQAVVPSGGPPTPKPGKPPPGKPPASVPKRRRSNAPGWATAVVGRKAPAAMPRPPKIPPSEEPGS